MELAESLEEAEVEESSELMEVIPSVRLALMSLFVA